MDILSNLRAADAEGAYKIFKNVRAKDQTAEMCTEAVRKNAKCFKNVSKKFQSAELIRLATEGDPILAFNKLDSTEYTPELVSRVFNNVRLTKKTRKDYETFVYKVVHSMPVNIDFIISMRRHGLIHERIIEEVSFGDAALRERYTNETRIAMPPAQEYNMVENSVHILDSHRHVSQYGNVFSAPNAVVVYGNNYVVRKFRTPFIIEKFGNVLEAFDTHVSVFVMRKCMRLGGYANRVYFLNLPNQRIERQHVEVAPRPQLPRGYKDTQIEDTTKSKIEAVVSTYKQQVETAPKALMYGGDVTANVESTTCDICLNDFVRDETVVTCGCSGCHNYCKECFEHMVKVQCDTKNGETFRPAEWMERQGRVMCDNYENIAFSDDVIMQFPRVFKYYMNSVVEYTAESSKKQACSAAAQIAEDAINAFVSGKVVTAKMAIAHIRDYIFTRRCPVCKAPFSDYTNCSAVHCDCGANFCGLCLDHHVDSMKTHAHVIYCELNPNKGTTYAVISPEVKAKIAEYTGTKTIKYIDSLKLSFNDKVEIISEIAVDAKDCGIPQQIFSTYIATELIE